jgi:hypothetical protein
VSARTFRVAPGDCSHYNLHPARHDGGHTVCLDCGAHVIVTEGRYGNELNAIAERDKLLDILDAASKRVENWSRDGLRAALVAHRDALFALQGQAREMGVIGASGNLARPFNDLGAAIFAIDMWTPPEAKPARPYCACSSPGCDICHPVVQ